MFGPEPVSALSASLWFESAQPYATAISIPPVRYRYMKSLSIVELGSIHLADNFFIQPMPYALKFCSPSTFAASRQIIE